MTRNNSFFAPKGVNISSGHLFGPKQLCPSLAAWQAAGQDAGSRAVAGLPSPSEIVASAKALLGEPRTSHKKGLATIKMKSDDIARLPLSLPIVRPRLLLLAALSLLPAAAIENGLGLTPPKGWRSWNFYLSRVNETVMRAQMRAAVDKTRTVNGVPTSLAELGYGAACELQRSRRAHRHWRSSHSCVETTSPRAVASQAAHSPTATSSPPRRAVRRYRGHGRRLAEVQLQLTRRPGWLTPQVWQLHVEQMGPGHWRGLQLPQPRSVAEQEHPRGGPCG